VAKPTSESVELHCVRCHKSFLEHKNHSKACAIPHNEDAESFGELVFHDDDTVTITLQCCLLEYDQETSPPEVCIVAAHTTKVAEVVYYDEYNETGNMNIVRCGKGCFREEEDDDDDGEDEEEGEEG